MARQILATAPDLLMALQPQEDARLMNNARGLELKIADLVVKLDAMTAELYNVNQLVTTGASATVGAGITSVILDGVDTTFALTFPVPADGQILRVQAATDVSVAFSTVATAPATVIKTTPATLVAGQGVAWVYRLSNTTWYRLY